MLEADGIDPQKLRLSFELTETFVAVNEELSATPEMVNDDPYGKAWLLKVEMSDAAELDALMDASAYQLYCEERAH